MRRNKDLQNYLLQKDVDSREKQKELLADSLNTDKKLPYEIRAEAQEILAEKMFDLESEEILKPLTMCVTTSREPSSFLKQFSKRFSLVFNAAYVQRGQMTSVEIKELPFDLVFILNENKGRCSSLFVILKNKNVELKFEVLSNVINAKDFHFKKKVGLILEVEFIEDFFKKLFPKYEKYDRYLIITGDQNRIVMKHFYNSESDFEMQIKIFEIVGEDKEWGIRPFTNSK